MCKTIKLQFLGHTQTWCFPNDTVWCIDCFLFNLFLRFSIVTCYIFSSWLYIIDKLFGFFLHSASFLLEFYWYSFSFFFIAKFPHQIIKICYLPIMTVSIHFNFIIPFSYIAILCFLVIKWMCFFYWLILLFQKIYWLCLEISMSLPCFVFLCNNNINKLFFFTLLYNGTLRQRAQVNHVQLP